MPSFANGRGIAHGGSNGQTVILPDVCKTPSPGGPVPIPYPNVGQSADAAGGPKSVTIEGKMPMVKGATYAKTNGDQAGSAGGVASGVTAGEAEFMTYSFDVKVEGKNVCRLGDALFQNKKNVAGGVEVGEPAGVAVAGEASAEVEIFRAKVIEVSFASPVEASWQEGFWTDEAKARAKVEAPHWEIGAHVEDGPKGSKRAAVYVAGGTRAVKVKVKVVESQNMPGDVRLEGRLGELEISGRCPSGAGEHVVNAEIAKLPDVIGWHAGDVLWGVDTGKSSLPLNATRLEVFVLPAPPVPKMYRDSGVWVEVLRFLCKKAEVIGLKGRVEIAEKVARYCITHGRANGLEYDHFEGASRYGPKTYGGKFELRKYLLLTTKKKDPRIERTLNCYDQAGAVETLLGALGVPAKWRFLEPYGFINTTQLMSRRCNNPFYKGDLHRKAGDDTDAIVDRDYHEIGTVTYPDGNKYESLRRIRSFFGNHAFCTVEADGGEDRVVDACAGPHTGTETADGYVKSAIDSDTKLYPVVQRFFGLSAGPGTAKAIEEDEPGYFGITNIK